MSERGAAMLEFVLITPFIALILAFIFNFGQLFLERQRAMVALREVGIRHSARFVDESGPALQPVADAVFAQNLAHRGITATVRERNAAGDCPPDGDGVDSRDVVSDLESAADRARGFLHAFTKLLSSAHSYEMEAAGRPMSAGLARDPVYRLCFAIDGSPWTARETGGPVDWVKALFSQTGELMDALF